MLIPWKMTQPNLKQKHYRIVRDIDFLSWLFSRKMYFRINLSNNINI